VNYRSSGCGRRPCGRTRATARRHGCDRVQAVDSLPARCGCRRPSRSTSTYRPPGVPDPTYDAPAVDAEDQPGERVDHRDGPGQGRDRDAGVLRLTRRPARPAKRARHPDGAGRGAVSRLRALTAPRTAGRPRRFGAVGVAATRPEEAAQAVLGRAVARSLRPPLVPRPRPARSAHSPAVGCCRCCWV
jgi:hypothetical protein